MSTAGRLVRRTRLVIGVTVAALLLGACTSTSPSIPDLISVPASGGTVVVGLDQPLTPCLRAPSGARSWADLQVLAPIAPSAFVTNANGFPALNDAVFSQIEVINTSPQTVVYSVNPQAVWQDGHRITAADLIANWQAGRVMTGPDQVGYNSISSITPDATGSTATVVFSTPDADWRALFATMVPAAVAASSRYRTCGALNPATFSSAGPFVLSSISATRATLTRNPRWWGVTAKLNQVVVATYTNHSALVSAMGSGQVHVIQTFGYDKADLVTLTAKPTATTQVVTTAAMTQAVFALGRGPTSNPLIREALANAFDRTTIALQATSYVSFEVTPLTTYLTPVIRVDTAGGNLGNGPVTTTTTTPATTTAPTAGQTTTTVTQPTSGPTPATASDATAAALLRQAGYHQQGGTWVSGGHVLAVVISWPSSSPQLGLAAEAIARSLGTFGVKASVVRAPSAESVAVGVHNGAYGIGLVARVATPYPTESQWWYSTATNATVIANPNRFNNASINASYTSVGAQLNPVTASPDLANIDATLWQELPAVPLFEATSLSAWGRVTGVTQNPWTTSVLESANAWAILVRVPAGTTQTPVLSPSTTPR